MILNGKSSKPRHEFKHPINKADDLILTERLRKLFRHDSNADSHGVYRVSSLYFDTPSDDALRQKLDGVNCREKFRIRYYGSDLSFIRLEKKMKLNGLCTKVSARLTEEETAMLIKGEPDFLLTKKDPLLLEFYSKIRSTLLAPKAVVIYDREAFLFEPGNVRITLDRDLRAGTDPKSFLSPTIPTLNASEGLTVLEVKYDEFLPELVKLAVGVPNRSASAHSKYALCRMFD